MRRLHLALLALLIASGAASVYGASPASVTGVVRDSAGVPQIGALVELLRSDLTVVASAYTDGKGHFTFSTVFPGHYAVKAMAASYLPSLRENVHVRTTTLINLTLNSLYEVVQWLPAERRGPQSQADDWKWTLRSAANRPLLRWLEDGPLVVVSEGPRSRPKLKARLVATGTEGAFGEDGQRIAVEVQNTPNDSRELLASVDFQPGSAASMESMLGFRQDLGFAGAVQSVAAIAIHPEVEAGGAAGLEEAAFRSSQMIRMGDEFEVEAGTMQSLARIAQGTSDITVTSLPFFNANWNTGDSTFRYELATALPARVEDGDAHSSTWMPEISVREGRLAVERGLHQELSWEHRTDSSSVTFAVYSETVRDPVLEAMGHFVDGSTAAQDEALYDRVSGMIRTAGPRYSSAGIMATAQHTLPGGSVVRANYATGEALVLPALPQAQSLRAIAAAAHGRRAASYSISLSGTLEGTGTRWRASYRWQPEDTLTRVAAFDADAAEPYFNLYLRQPICRRGGGVKSLDAMLDIHNLLAQGDRHFTLADGSLLVFAQDQRSVTAGLAFTF